MRALWGNPHRGLTIPLNPSEDHTGGRLWYTLYPTKGLFLHLAPEPSAYRITTSNRTGASPVCSHDTQEYHGSGIDLLCI